VAQKRRKFSPEFRDEAVKMVVVESRPIAEVAREIQVNEGTLGTWVSRYRQEHAGEEPPLNISERARLRELERENRACAGSDEGDEVGRGDRSPAGLGGRTC
jgi:transposase-like protein